MERFQIKYKRGHGPGGQHKNKVESCVVAFDPVTEMKETCQDTRSQAKNRVLAMDRLTKRIRMREEFVKAGKRAALRKKLIGGGKSIRTYNFARSEVVDHRTNKRAPLGKVLNGRPDLLH